MRGLPGALRLAPARTERSGFAAHSTARRRVWRPGVESPGVAAAGTAAPLGLPFLVAVDGGRHSYGRIVGGGVPGGPFLSPAANQADCADGRGRSAGWRAHPEIGR